MIPTVSIVGKSGAGKTTLIEKLVAEFKQRGYRVAVVKHGIGRVEMDQPGKDSWRFAEAGSDAVIVSSPDKLALVRQVDSDTSLGEILRLLGNSFDLVLIEGFKKARSPKIELTREEFGGELLCSVKELSAVVTDCDLDIAVPQLPLSKVTEVADFIEHNLMFPGAEDTMLFVNGEPVVMNSFIKAIMARTAMAIISSLKNIGDVANFDISFRKNP
jgi:molybdopterin-guanine dinucleotide biosynthesis protein MobB